MQYSQEHLKTMVYAEFGGQKECIMGNWKIENRGQSCSRSSVERFLFLFRSLQTRRVLHSTRQLRTLTHEPTVKKTFVRVSFHNNGKVIQQWRSELVTEYTPSNQFELTSVVSKSIDICSLNIQLNCTQLHYSCDRKFFHFRTI